MFLTMIIRCLIFTISFQLIGTNIVCVVQALHRSLNAQMKCSSEDNYILLLEKHANNLMT